MGVEGRGRGSAKLGFPLRQQFVVGIALHQRRGEVQAQDRLAGVGHDVRREGRVGSHQNGVLQSGDAIDLVGDEVHFRLEDRIEQDVGRVGRNLGQDRQHFRVADVDGALVGNAPAQLDERVGHDFLKLVRIGTAVMDGGGRPGSQLVVGEFRGQLALEQVVVRSPVVAGLPDAAVLRIRIGEGRRGVGRRNHAEPGLVDDGQGGGRGTRAGGSQ